PPKNPRGPTRFGVTYSVGGGFRAFQRMIRPITIKYTLIHGRIVSPGIFERTYAPSAPPIMPGMTSRAIRRRSQLSCHQWARPDAPVVTTSAACTHALVIAGGTPVLSSTDETVTP